MIRHIVKLIKSRLRSNLWILSELLVVFIILWFMTDYFLMNGVEMSRPVGFKVDNVYRLTVALRPTNSPSYITYEAGSSEPRDNFIRLVDQIGRHPDVEAVSVSFFSLPYDRSNSNTGVQRDSVHFDVRRFVVTPDYFRVFDIRPLAGGKPEELIARFDGPVIISAGLAHEMFGDEEAIRKEFLFSGDSIPRHVMAVTEPIRGDEYRKQTKNIFEPLLLNKHGGDNPTEEAFKTLQVCFRTRPGVASPDYAGHFLKEMKQRLKIGNYWVSDVKSYTEIRTAYLDNTKEASSRKLFSVLGGFFLVNVFLAVIGTFWFHAVRRRSEMGLRMAVGSRRKSILNLMIGEGLMLMTIAALPALLICLNLALLGVFSDSVMKMTIIRFLSVSLLTWCMLAVVILLATWYPARKASRLAPADALHYE